MHLGAIELGRRDAQIDFAALPARPFGITRVQPRDIARREAGERGREGQEVGVENALLGAPCIGELHQPRDFHFGD